MGLSNYCRRILNRNVLRGFFLHGGPSPFRASPGFSGVEEAPGEGSIIGANGAGEISIPCGGRILPQPEPLPAGNQTSNACFLQAGVFSMVVCHLVQAWTGWKAEAGKQPPVCLPYGEVSDGPSGLWIHPGPQKEVFPTRGSRSPFRHPGYTKPKPKWDVHMDGGQAAVSVRPSGTFGRASLWRLSQSSSPHKCRSHLGFDLGCRRISRPRSGRPGAWRSGRPV